MESDARSHAGVRVHCFFAAFLSLLTLAGAPKASGLAGEYDLLTVLIDGQPYYAELRENRELLASIRVRDGISTAKHFRGSLLGYPDTAVRVSRSRERWRGVVIKGDTLYRIDQSVLSALTWGNSSAVQARPMLSQPSSLPASERPVCGMESLLGGNEAGALSMAEMAEPVAVTALAPAVSSPPCVDPVNGVCLLPHIELAYDLSYQAMPNFGMSVLDRALGEINEMEMFFERGLGYRFSQLSLTLLNSTEDLHAGSASATSINQLIADLRLKRGGGELAYLQSERSIFQFVTGRNFPPDDSGSNVVGIAYPNAVCDVGGYSLGITDAGDVGAVNDPANSLVSLIMAHEIGHNLGAGHDQDQNSCAADQFVMTASVGANGQFITDFSECSIEEIQQEVGKFVGTAACLDFPIDVGIAEQAGNPVSPARGVVVDSAYTVSTKRNAGAGLATQLGIYGEISDVDSGCFVEVSAGGAQNCLIADDGRSYQCNLTNPPSPLDLQVTIVVEENAGEFNADHRVYSGNSSLIEVDPANDTLNQFYNTFSMPGALDTPRGCGNPPSQSTNTDSSSSGTQSGGGGGAFGPLLLLPLLFGLIRRYCPACRNSG